MQSQQYDCQETHHLDIYICDYLLISFRCFSLGGDLIRNIGPDMKVCKVDILAIIRSI